MNTDKQQICDAVDEAYYQSGIVGVVCGVALGYAVALIVKLLPQKIRNNILERVKNWLDKTSQ